MTNISIYAIPCIRQADQTVQKNNGNSSRYIKKVIQTVCDHFGTTWQQVNIVTRRREIAVPRQFIMHILATKSNLSLKNIGHLFDKKYDHTTVIHSKNVINNLVFSDPHIKADLEQILNKL